MKTTAALLILAVACLSGGCVSVGTIERLDAKLKAFEALGVSEVVVTGKVSHTQYTVTREGGQRTAVLEHSNPWTPRIYLVRRTAD